MSKKKKVQTLAEQWAAYLYLKKETKLCIPAMDAMRHAAAIRMWIPAPEKVTWETKCIQEERRSRGTVFGISFSGKAYQRTGTVFAPECRELPVFMEPDAQRSQDNRQFPNTGSVQKKL